MAEQPFTVNERNNMYTTAAMPVAEDSKTATREVASLVLGILSLYLTFSNALPVLGYFIALIVGIVGAVMGNRARKEAAPGSVLAKAGYVCSIIGIVFSAIMIVLLVVLATTAGVALSQVGDQLPQIMNSLGM